MTWIGEFMRANPKIQLDFVLGDAAVDLIAQGIDIAFRAGVLADSSYVIRKISDAFAVLVASPRTALQNTFPQKQFPIWRRCPVL